MVPRVTSSTMTIVAARRYRHGYIVEPDLIANRGDRQPGDFDWVGLVDPTEAEVEWLRTVYHLHPLAIEDALTPRHPPKAESYGDRLFVVARTIADAPDREQEIAFGQTAIFLAKDHIITVRLGSNRPHSDLRQQLEAVPERLAEGPDFVLHGVLDFIAGGYDPVLERLEQKVAGMEDRAIDQFPDQDRITEVFRLRRVLRRLESTAGRMEEMAGKLAEVDQPAIDPAARPYFRDVHDATRRIVSRVHWLLGSLGTLLEVASLLEQNRQGLITRQLAAWAAILAVPTAIAGIYGMNFDFMPELRWRYGYFLVLATMVSICSALYLRFKRIGWL